MHAFTPRLLVGLLSLLMLTTGCDPDELELPAQPQLPQNPEDWQTETDAPTTAQGEETVGPCEGVCSCEDVCGQAPTDKSCFCDEFCHLADDCCDDFAAVCDEDATGGDLAPDDQDDNATAGDDGWGGDDGDDDDSGDDNDDDGWGDDDGDDDGDDGGPCEGTCSCQDACGEAPADESCFCDDVCSEYGDCCPDFESLCDGGGDDGGGWDDDGGDDDGGWGDDDGDGEGPCDGTCSCQDACGEAPADESCFCDDACAEYGDCCPDFESLCDGGGDGGGDGGSGWGDDVDPPSGDDDTTSVTSPFSVSTVPNSLSAFQPFFTKYVNVFGVNIFGRATVSDSKLLYAANIMAEYLDNDEDGIVDNPAVLSAMVNQPGGSSLVMFANESDLESSGIFDASIPDIYPSQDLHASETFPQGSSAATGFDASLEEVFHLISSQGYAQAYPDVFGEEDSALTDAMDLARGGKFMSIPSSYPAAAWYHYDDTTCDYRCMATEYIYWGLTSLLGAQDYPGRCEEIAEEWELCTPAAFTGGDPTLHTLLTEPSYALPTVLPDGVYAPGS